MSRESGTHAGLSYRDVDLGSSVDRELLTRWYNDPTSKHLYSRFADAEAYSRQVQAQNWPASAEASSAGLRRQLLVLVEGVAIGEASYEIDSDKLLSTAPQTAWLALVIGEERLRGCGLGARIAAHLEALAAKAGARHCEVGVFAYNSRALSFFVGLGYEEFLRRPDRAWWDGRMWSEVRLLKPLPAQGGSVDTAQ